MFRRLQHTSRRVVKMIHVSPYEMQLKCKLHGMCSQQTNATVVLVAVAISDPLHEE